jgi:uncharacterized protein YaaN involved in tellurite resistance
MVTPSTSALGGSLSKAGRPSALAELAPERRARVEALIGAIDPQSAQTIIAFGVEAQRELTAVSERILEGVRNKDTGPAGAALNQMMLRVRDLGVDDLRKGGRLTWFERTVLRRISPLASFLQRYETVSGQVERVQSELEGHRLKLVEDITRLDALYDVTLTYFHRLEDHIVAAVERLHRLHEAEIPALERRAAEGGDLLAAQRLADLRGACADLERKAHDLKLTRQVTMQSLPGIRMNQELDKSLATKIQSVLLNTLPIWKNQLAQAVTLFRTREAAATLEDVSRLTNELLEANAGNLRDASAGVRTAVERSVFSIESLEKANRLLIATIEDSLAATEQARARRRETESRLISCEAALKETLRQAAA